ncbi:hypothetical protein [Achromobacter xylosoxidans]|uniref:hypothetical protein n=1 Tax=Alcaligenes xylosoxydans xylosoxydans TaxID=85698 RepID=UPI000A590D9B|nr:hypothetical protein [Achromobacter xylosoxidans]
MPDEQTRIASEVEAEHLAVAWAVAHGLLLRDVRLFAREWYSSTPVELRTKQQLNLSLQFFSLKVNSDTAEWNRTFSLFADLASTWNLETVKHLAIFNVAGLAGAAALVAGTKYADHFAMKLSLPTFAIGLLMALLTLWTRTRGYSASLDNIDKQRKKSLAAGTWQELHSAWQPPVTAMKPSDWHSIGNRTGWASALIGTLGVVLVGAAILT